MAFENGESYVTVTSSVAFPPAVVTGSVVTAHSCSCDGYLRLYDNTGKRVICRERAVLRRERSQVLPERWLMRIDVIGTGSVGDVLPLLS